MSVEVQRFIVAPQSITMAGVYLVILVDYQFWAENIDELADWCEERKTAISQGMTVSFFDEATLSEFILKWS